MTVPKPVKLAMSFTVDVDPFWFEHVTQHNDLFARGGIGYWAVDVAWTPFLGWLVFEHGGDTLVDDEETARVEALWAAGQPLPPRWHRLDRTSALRAWEEGVKRWGIRWYVDADATREDIAIQLALLGEVRYG